MMSLEEKARKPDPRSTTPASLPGVVSARVRWRGVCRAAWPLRREGRRKTWPGRSSARNAQNRRTTPCEIGACRRSSPGHRHFDPL